MRGEIDNREKGRVRGRLWLAGRPEPVEIELAGNCWRDLAGCLLTFTNPRPEARDLEGFAETQHGACGDMTASRKVKIPLLPLREIIEKKIKPFPFEWGNSIYLEWFSERNGRVVIEAHDYQHQISLPAWRLTEAEEREQGAKNAGLMGDFMKRLADGVAQRKKNDDERGEERA